MARNEVPYGLRGLFAMAMGGAASAAIARPARVKSTRPKDSQKEKLYRSERPLFPEKPELPEVSDVQAYVDKVVRDPWTRRHFTHMPFRIRVEAGGHGRRRGIAIGSTIKMPRWTRTKLYTLHEVAHCATPNRYAAHGREYAATYLKLVRHFLGVKVHDQLRANFKANRVKYTPKKASAGKRPGNMDGLVKARAVLAAKRAAGQAPQPGMVKHGKHWIFPNGSSITFVEAATDRLRDVALAIGNSC